MERKAVSAGEGGMLTTNDRGLYERALTLGHHPHRLTAELTDPDLLPLAPTGLGHKLRMPTLAAAIARVQLHTLPSRMATAEANLAHLREVLHANGAPIDAVPAGPDAVRGWYHTPLAVSRPVDDPHALQAACAAEGIPVRPLYDDWLSSPLLRDAALLQARFPHLRHSRWSPPDLDAFPNYRRARHQLLLIKVPDVPAADYMDQTGAAIAKVLTRT